jgi:hypothetical protein
VKCKKMQLFCAIPRDLPACSYRFTKEQNTATARKTEDNSLRCYAASYKVIFSTYPRNTSAANCHTKKRDIYFSLVSALSFDLRIFIVLYCIVFLFSPNIMHMTVDSSVCNIF